MILTGVSNIWVCITKARFVCYCVYMFLSAYSLHLALVQIVLLHPNPPAPPLIPLLLFAVFLKPKSLWGFPPTMVGRVCVVIGAGPGLGIACARRWAREGYKVPNYY